MFLDGYSDVVCCMRGDNPAKKDGWVIFGAVLLAIGLFIIKVIVIWLIWNALVPYVFRGPLLNFWQALLFVIAISLLFRV
jgi:hypothetical protein